MKSDFLKYQAQTSPFPLSIEVSHAKGSYIYDSDGKAYLDFVAGVSANSLGHNNPAINEAVKKQIDSYAGSLTIISNILRDFCSFLS